MLSEQKRAFIAVVLSGIVLFAWQFFFAPKMPEQKVNPAHLTEQAKIIENRQADVANISTATSKDQSQKSQDHVSQVYVLENSKLGKSIRINSALEILDFNGSNNFISLNDFTGGKKVLSLSYTDSRGVNQNFFLENALVEKDVLKGKDLSLNAEVELRYTDEGKLDFKILGLSAVKYKFNLTTSTQEIDKNHHREFLFFTNKVTREKSGSETEVDGHLKWIGIDYNYHLFAIALKDKLTGKGFTTKDGEMHFESSEGVNKLEGQLVFVKKNYDDLMALGNNLEQAVDFGSWGIIAVPILRGLQFFYKFIPNYGISIIFLTILIRLITFPLQYKSFKSMKKMQLIQPELNKIKEKYKEDPQKMQKETMELFKKAGANPLGGCLPLLLQMPVFMAFYKVLYAAVELVNAPFVGWIRDLSVKDPYFVLPVLMTATMFIQQKMTPSTGGDPAQQKIMMFMPLIFGFIMKDLPAGLVLYIFVSTLMGIGQQLLVNKSKTA